MKTSDIRLLLVDDEEEFRETTANRLARRGFPLERARDGEECLSVLASAPVDVVVLDVKMPGMNGIEVLGVIKKKYPKTEVILLTGHAATQDGVDGIKTGAFDYLAKPVELDHLIGKIKQAYEKIQREEEKEREAQFRLDIEQQMTACERLASLGTLAAGVAHEINNPLAIIKESTGWMKGLLEKAELTEMPRKGDFANALAKIETSVERMKRVTHQLLGFARKEEPALSEVDLRILIEEALGLVGREASYRDVALKEDVHPDVGKIWSDPYRLRQVLVNLLTNAIHATGRGGAVSISVEDRGAMAALLVRDTGSGIPKENLNRIFEPFFSTKPAGEGTGLGLFVSRSILERLGGSIEVESRLGEGSTFRVLLPKKPAAGDPFGRDDRLQILDKIRDLTRPILE